MQSSSVHEHLLHRVGFFVPQTQPSPTVLVLRDVGVQDEPLVVEGDSDLESGVISKHVIPLQVSAQYSRPRFELLKLYLVHIDGVGLVGHDLV